MAKTNKITRSFNAGELSPFMDPRSDQSKYDAGAKTMENFIPLIYGAAQRRPGTEFIANAKSNSVKSRLIAFEQTVTNTYILEFSSTNLRVFKDGALINTAIGNEDLSIASLGNIVAHWKLNDDLATTVVLDADGNDHEATATSNTSVLRTIGKAGAGCFNFHGTDAAKISDRAAFTFGNGTVDSPFSIMAWVYITEGTDNQTILSKFDTNGAREWAFQVQASRRFRLLLSDQSVTINISRLSDDALSRGWHHVACTYAGQSDNSGNDAADFITLYVDGVVVDSTSDNDGTYDAMEDKDGRLVIGATLATNVLTEIWQDKIDDVSIFSDVLTADEISTYFADTTSTAFEIETPYQEADLFQLKFEHSADVLFIAHPNYEPRRLLRFADDDWVLEVENLQTGPFRDQNVDTAITITANAQTGTGITLTASGGAIFNTLHAPDGVTPLSAVQTGTLFKLVQAVSGSDANISEEINSNTLNAATSTLAVPKGVTWDLTTLGGWGATNTSTLVLERSYDNETTYETVFVVTSKDNKNVITSGTEEVADALYRMRVSEASGTGNAEIQFSIRDTSHIGIVKITAVASTTSATADVLATLASTDPTHRFSEGSWSRLRGFPNDVVISAEERLTFGGNVSEPLTVWGSAIGDFPNFREGTDDDDAIQFTLVGSGKQNQIFWLVAKNSLVVGTVGGEHLLGASSDEEALTPTNVKAKLQTTYGSENIAAIIVNQAVLFVQRGGKKVREFLYNFEADAHKADDLTIFAEHITGTGITDIAFQRTPDPMLWCVRVDGQLAVLTYERDQNVFAWYRVVTNTNLAGTATASVIESVAVIYGGTRSEDEVWISVLRQINNTDARYIERFRPRLLPSSQSDYRFLDSSITKTPVGTTVSGLTHLEGQAVQVLGDGLVQTETTSGDFIVGGGVKPAGEIIVPSGITTAQIGIGFDSTLVPMDLDIEGTGLTTTKRVNRVHVNLFETISGTLGPDSSRQEVIDKGTTLFTGPREIDIPGGYSRDTDITIKQIKPLPMTVLSIGYDLGASND